MILFFQLIHENLSFELVYIEPHSVINRELISYLGFTKNALIPRVDNGAARLILPKRNSCTMAVLNVRCVESGDNY